MYMMFMVLSRCIYIQLARQIKMCLNEAYSKVNVGKLLSDKFPIQNGLK